MPELDWGRKLEQAALLEDGWDSYRAPRPSLASIEAARRVILALGPPHRVEPSAMGGMGVTYRSGTKKAYVECYNAGNTHYLFCDDSSEEMHTGPVLDLGKLFDDVREYFAS